MLRSFFQWGRKCGESSGGKLLSVSVFAEVIDEVPFIFQQRNISFRVQLQANEGKQICYHLRPTSRGIYGFGQIRVFVTGRIGLLSRRYTCGEEQDIKVYPSYLMLHRYELLAMSDNLTELGIKRIRRVGHHTEFEQIKEYVKGMTTVQSTGKPVPAGMNLW